ncbi:hypothetical protein F750_6979 [Streptomyces sp. PAMC 26508]|nr:hypothetical protein F750_6979 [Streptomyces sp. PAMC 26508]
MRPWDGGHHRAGPSPQGAPPPGGHREARLTERRSRYGRDDHAECVESDEVPPGFRWAS